MHSPTQEPRSRRRAPLLPKGLQPHFFLERPFLNFIQPRRIETLLSEVNLQRRERQDFTEYRTPSCWTWSKTGPDHAKGWLAAHNTTAAHLSPPRSLLPPRQRVLSRFWATHVHCTRSPATGGSGTAGPSSSSSAHAARQSTFRCMRALHIRHVAPAQSVRVECRRRLRGLGPAPRRWAVGGTARGGSRERQHPREQRPTRAGMLGPEVCLNLELRGVRGNEPINRATTRERLSRAALPQRCDVRGVELERRHHAWCDPVERSSFYPVHILLHEHGEANAFDAQRTVDQAFCVAFLGVESFEFLENQAHNGALVFREDLELLAQRWMSGGFGRGGGVVDQAVPCCGHPVPTNARPWRVRERRRKRKLPVSVMIRSRGRSHVGEFIGHAPPRQAVNQSPCCQSTGQTAANPRNLQVVGGR